MPLPYIKLEITLKLSTSARFIFLLAMALIASTTSGATTTEWTYQSYDINSGNIANPGYLTLEESDKGATLKIFVPALVKCFSQTLDAIVERTAKFITITTTPAIPGCDQNRFVLKVDGTGGTRYTKVNDKWVRDTRERILTIKN
jgi:hypothetical protein